MVCPGEQPTVLDQLIPSPLPWMTTLVFTTAPAIVHAPPTPAIAAIVPFTRPPHRKPARISTAPRHTRAALTRNMPRFDPQPTKLPVFRARIAFLGMPNKKPLPGGEPGRGESALVTRGSNPR